MNVLVVHNRYIESGGEDRVVELESALLERLGHRVLRYTADNDRIQTLTRTELARRTLWSREAYWDVRHLIAREGVDLVHVHNTLPLISPSVYYAARAEGRPVVQSVHNYRLICPSANCVRDGAPCTACVGSIVPWQGVRHACYRNSRTATAGVVGTLLLHRLLRTWSRAVDVFIAPTAFTRGMLVAGGLPADRIAVKPHFVNPDPGVGSFAGGYALYAGRLAVDKGVSTLLAAWRRLGARLPLTIVGDGPLAAQVQDATRHLPQVAWAGHQPHSYVQQLIRQAAVIIAPSIAFETFGQVIIEAYAAGVPVIACEGGAAMDLVQHGSTGLLAKRGDVDDLVAQVEWLLAHPDAARAMRSAARAAYETQFTADLNAQMLSEIYEQALARVEGRVAVPQQPSRLGVALGELRQ